MHASKEREADRCGLVSRLVAADVLKRETMALAAQIAAYFLPALMAIKDSPQLLAGRMSR